MHEGNEVASVGGRGKGGSSAVRTWISVRIFAIVCSSSPVRSCASTTWRRLRAAAPAEAGLRV
jgi:hypothetical protein